MAAGDLIGVTSVVVVDWPTRDVPESLVGAGLAVSVHGGPRPEDWAVHELGPDGTTVVERKAPDLMLEYWQVPKSNSIVDEGKRSSGRGWRNVRLIQG